MRGEDVDGPGVSLFAAGGETCPYPRLHAVPFALGGKCTAETYREENTERTVKKINPQNFQAKDSGQFFTEHISPSAQ